MVFFLHLHVAVVYHTGGWRVCAHPCRLLRKAQTCSLETGVILHCPERPGALQLHAAVVELSAGARARIKYSTVQNWYAGDEEGVGGIYNFVTKRGLCHGAASHISWTQACPRGALASAGQQCMRVDA